MTQVRQSHIKLQLGVGGVWGKAKTGGRESTGMPRNENQHLNDYNSYSAPKEESKTFKFGNF